MSAPRRIRAERERINRAFHASIVLPAIGQAARLAVPPSLVMSAALSEIESCKELRYVLGPIRWPRRAATRRTR